MDITSVTSHVLFKYNEVIFMFDEYSHKLYRTGKFFPLVKWMCRSILVIELALL